MKAMLRYLARLLAPKTLELTKEQREEILLSCHPKCC